MAGRHKHHKGRLNAVWLVAGAPRRQGRAQGKRWTRWNVTAGIGPFPNLQLTKQITLDQRTPISLPVSVCRPTGPLFRERCLLPTSQLYDEYRNPRSSLLVSVDTPHPFRSRSFVELVSDNGKAFRPCCGSDEKVIVRSEWAISRRGRGVVVTSSWKRGDEAIDAIGPVIGVIWVE